MLGLRSPFMSREETPMICSRRTGTAIAVAAAFGAGPLGLAASAPAADTPTHVVAADVNDAGIDASRGSNHVWLAPDPARRVGKLLVFMSGGGGTKLPPDWHQVGRGGGPPGCH